jgi:hypothetical protein
MAIATQGKKGFQTLPKDQQKTAKGIYYLTPSEMKHFKAYCKDKNVKPSILVRDMIKARIKHLKTEIDHNPNQLRID